MFQNVINTRIANGAAESRAIDLRETFPSLGLVHIPAWTAANLAFKVASSLDGTYAPLRNASGALVEISGIQTAAPGWYRLPEELNGASFVKMWSETAGSDVNQGAERAIQIVGKG